VQTVPTAEVALLLLREKIAFDLLITDVVMPHGLNGFELADLARTLQPGLRVLYLTGFVNLPRRQIADLGGKLLRKPLAPGELEREIRAALTRRVGANERPLGVIERLPV
jgi:DNA-binding response OmpR family regulator